MSPKALARWKNYIGTIRTAETTANGGAQGVVAPPKAGVANDKEEDDEDDDGVRYSKREPYFKEGLGTMILMLHMSCGNNHANTFAPMMDPPNPPFIIIGPLIIN